MTRWTMTSFCLLMVVVSMVTLSDGKPNLRFAEDHIKRMIRSEDIDGYDTATLYAVDTTTNEETRQTKRDIETHASDSSSDKRRFSLQLASGERLRMSLVRRSVVTSGTKLTEITEEGEREITLPRRDCFFSGRLEGGADGFASLAMCDGDLMGSITTAKRDYDIHTLRHTNRQRSADDVMRVLVTWRNKNRKRGDDGVKIPDDDGVEIPVDDGVEIPVDDGVEIPVDDGVEIPVDDGVEIPDDGMDVSERNGKDQSGRQIRNLDSTKDNTGHSPLVKRSLDDRKAAIEIGDFVDRHFLYHVNKKLGFNTTQKVIDLIITKWSGVASVLSDEERLGWNLTLRLAKVTIMRTDPVYYNTTELETIGERLSNICYGTMSMTFDHVALHTGRTSNWNYIGLAYIGTLCKRRHRCSASRNFKYDFSTEIHELGHNMGLNHDGKMTQCLNDTDTYYGFMSNNKTHIRNCYRPVLDSHFLSGKKDCIFEDHYSEYVFQ